MDTGTIIISAILIVLAILPFLFTGKKYRKQKKQMVLALKSMAEQHQLKLSNYEASGNFGIGLDSDSRYLFFARVVQDEISARTVLLADMNRCKVKTSSRMLEDGEKVIDRVELALYPVSSAQAEVVLEMYNSEYDTLTIRGELQAAVKWEHIIGEVLKKSKRKEQKLVSSKQIAFA